MRTVSLTSTEQAAAMPSADPDVTAIATPGRGVLPYAQGSEPPPEPASLRRNFSWTFAGNVIYAACQWGVLVVLAKGGSMETVGQFAWGLAVSSPIMLFAAMQLREVQATDARGQFRFGHYFALRCVCLLLALAAVAAFAVWSPATWATAAVVMLVGLGKAFDGVSDIVFGLFQRREQMKPVSAVLTVNGVVTLAAVAVAIALTGSVVWAAAAFALGSAAATLVAVVQAARIAGGAAALRPQWEGAPLWSLLRLALPLGIVALMISTNTNMPRYFVEHHLGPAALGAFAALAYVMQAGTTVTIALGQSSSARLARRYADGDMAGFCRLLLKLAGTGAALGLAGVAVAAFAGEQLLTVVYRPEYARYADVFTWTMAAAGVAYVATFLNSAMIASRSIRAKTALFAVVFATGVATCWFLVPRYGLTGAAWATGLTLLVQLAGATAVIARAVWRGGPGAAPQPHGPGPKGAERTLGS